MRYVHVKFKSLLGEIEGKNTVWAAVTRAQERARVILPSLRRCPPRAKWRRDLDKKWIWHRVNYKGNIRSAEYHYTWARFDYWDGSSKWITLDGDEKAIARRVFETKPVFA